MIPALFIFKSKITEEIAYEIIATSLKLNISTNTTELQGGQHYLKKSIYTNYDELPLLLSVKQLVDLMGVSDSTIYELIQEDDFPSLRIGKRIVVPKEELRKWISAHTKGVQE